jgi:hypothetical protein
MQRNMQTSVIGLVTIMLDNHREQVCKFLSLRFSSFGDTNLHART